MRYISTRDGENTFNCLQVILKGLANDGGLFVSEKIPKIDEKEIKDFVSLKYCDLAFSILKRFFTDIKQQDLKKAIENAYKAEKFSCCDVVNVKNLSSSLSVLELWHGPTLAFKDVALQFLPHIMKVCIKNSKIFKGALILTATSGDTGKAALEGFKDIENIKIFVLYPKDGVSKVQKLSMITQTGENVFVLGVNGNFDDAQQAVKKILVDKDLKKILDEKKFVVSSANSINWARLAAQIVYYFFAYCNMVKNKTINYKDKINVIVPTGNFGNILACFYAKQMGLFIEDIVIASNKNSILVDFINSGIYDGNRDFYKTISPSMDILVSSNLERLLYFFYGKEQFEKIKSLYEEFSKTKKFKISDSVLKKIKEQFYANYCNDFETKNTILNVYKKFKYLCDPHTAVAFNVCKKYLAQKRNSFKNLVVSTASPLKFAKDVLESLGELKDLSYEQSAKKICEMLKVSLPKFFQNINKEKIRFKKAAEKEQIKDILIKKIIFVI